MCTHEKYSKCVWKANADRDSMIMTYIEFEYVRHP